MAIPGYDDSAEAFVVDAEASLRPLIGIMGDTFKEVSQNILDLRQAIMSIGPYQTIIDAEGRVDLSKIEKFPVYSNIDTDIVYYGSIYDYPPACAVAYINGQKSVLFGEYAQRYIEQMSIVAPTQLLAPIISIVSAGGYSVFPGENDSWGNDIFFAASFATRYGETSLSNVVRFGPVSDWTTITIDVDDSSIPEYATGIYFYRLFGSVFRLIYEVKL